MTVYDPCSGSGGMLVLAKEFLDEHQKNSKNLRLAGQESNGGVWAISKMNMLLHGIADADMRNGDTLADPLHTEGGELMRFDRVVTNPPFSQNYSQDGLLMPVRASLLTSFEKAVRPAGLLDRFQVTGVIATWWDDVQNDLKGLAAQGFGGLVEAWATSIRAALEDGEGKGKPDRPPADQAPPAPVPRRHRRLRGQESRA